MNVPLDRNKTQNTHEVTEAATRWLDEHGFKPIETEVRVSGGWCADIAGVISPTNTELIELKLLSRKPSWKLCKTPLWDAWETRADALRRVMTCLVEVKTSRGDFRSDPKWRAARPVDLAYLAVPAGMIAPEEWPEGWGILEYRNGAVKALRAPTIAPASAEQQRDVVLQIAVRRDHHTRYARFRENEKLKRMDDEERTTVRRLRDVMRAVTAVATAKYPTVEDCLLWCGLRKLPEHLVEELRPLYGIAAVGKVPA